jgi:hypothetical protein
VEGSGAPWRFVQEEDVALWEVCERPGQAAHRCCVCVWEGHTMHVMRASMGRWSMRVVHGQNVNVAMRERAEERFRNGAVRRGGGEVGVSLCGYGRRAGAGYCDVLPSTSGARYLAISARQRCESGSSSGTRT